MNFASLVAERPVPIAEFRLAVLDMSGTTVTDDGRVEDAFAQALAAEGIFSADSRFQPMLAYFREGMGLPKISVFRRLFGEHNGQAERVNRSFELSYDEVISAGGVRAIPGAERTIGELQEAGINVCLTTGFARHTQNSILESLGWMGLADLSLCPDDAGRGCPFPDMILTAALALDLPDVRQIIVAGDTTSDILAGLRSGASTVLGVRTGVHSEAALRAAGAHDVVPSVAELPTFLPGVAKLSGA